MTTKERKNELRTLAARRVRASTPNDEAHALAVKKTSGTATEAEIRRLDKLVKRYLRSKSHSVPAFLNSKAEADLLESYVETASERGEKEAERRQFQNAILQRAKPEAARGKPPHANLFRRDGDVWQLVFEGRKIEAVRHLAGMTYIRALLSRPGDDLPARDLYEIENPPPPEAVARLKTLDRDACAHYGTGGKAQRICEGQTPDNLRKAKTALQDKLEGEDLSDKQRDGIEQDIEAIDDALKDSRLAKFEPKEKKQPRQAVAARIEAAIDGIADKPCGANLAKHLRRAIQKGQSLSYAEGLTWET